eukprot:58693_1
MNNTMDDIDNKHIIDNAHFSETQYKLVNMNGCTVLDEIYQYLENNVDVSTVEEFKHLMEVEEYDSDCVEYDIPNGNIFNCIENKEDIHHEITQIMIKSKKYEDIYFKCNESFNISPGSYQIYLKNEK